MSSHRIPRTPGVPEARQYLRNMVVRLQYPSHTQNLIVSQLVDVWTRYGLRPMAGIPSSLTSDNQAHSGRRIICMSGNLPITVASRSYSVPVRVWILLPYPDTLPLVHVLEYEGAIIAPNHRIVSSPSGVVNLSALQPSIWRPGENNLRQILYRLQLEFAVRPPLVGDPAWAERKASSTELLSRVQRRMLDETESAKYRFVSMQSELDAARSRGSFLDVETKRTAEAAGGGAGVILCGVRNERNSIEALADEYGVDIESDEADPDVSVDEVLAISSGNPMRDQMDDLEAEDRASADALDSISDAFAKQVIELPIFLKMTKEILEQQFITRARMNKVAAEMVAAVEAESAAAPGESEKEFGLRGNYEGLGSRQSVQESQPRRAGSSHSRSTLLTSGMIPFRYVARAGGGGTAIDAPPDLRSDAISELKRTS